jgi:hypothetical protein
MTASSVIYLEPVGDFDVEFGDALHPVAKDLSSLGWLEICLAILRKSQSNSWRTRVFAGEASTSSFRVVYTALTNIAGYSTRIESSIVAVGVEDR